jgi:hypothetical protein
MNLLHLICTIYNIGNTNEEWLNERFDIFKEFTIPSILNQTNQNFLWVVILDGSTAGKHLTDLYAATNYQSNIVFVMSPPADISHKPSVYGTFPIAKKVIQGMIPNTINIVATTGLDNDDALCNNYVEEIQEEAWRLRMQAEQGYPFILDVGIELDIDYRTNEYGLININADQHPSVTSTVVESTRNPRTVMAGMHGEIWNRDFPEKRIFQERLIIPTLTCLHIIHGGNAGLVDNQKWRVNRPINFKDAKREHGEGYDWLPNLFKSRRVLNG